ncbi:acyl carrier protein [Actinoplanes sp. TFC3]|uniref:acyl carrier protein n=1 Tax=Actinoplanes sp. TFC3 TaxID=1710355 RepID=UPI00083786BF|nr:acyl carrier protein [Actinoplanes sp. TFC3]
MTENDIFHLVVSHTREILPELGSHQFRPTDSLRELGANSIDRAEIITMTLESLSVDIPLVELAGATNIGELVSTVHAKSGS